MWLQPSFFCIGDLQLEHGFELVTSHRQFAEFSSASSVPDTIHSTHHKIQSMMCKVSEPKKVNAKVLPKL